MFERGAARSTRSDTRVRRVCQCRGLRKGLWVCMNPLLSTSARAGAGVMTRRPAPIQPAINHESLPCLIYLP